MMYSIDEIRERVEPVAKKYNLASVYLFGSYARGDACGDSDIDLLVDIHDSDIVGFAFGGLSHDLEDGLDKGVDLLTTNIFERTDKAPPSRLRLMTSVLRERVPLYER